MKKLLKVFIILVLLFVGFHVHAQEYHIMENIPVGTTATIDTDIFTYTNFYYVQKVEGKEYGRFVFESVTNKTTKSIPISINILLFDLEGKNVGFVSYCTGEDVESDYAQKKLGAGASTPFSINVAKRYFVEGKTTDDVVSYAVMDDNEYCHTGGFDKYAGLTLSEISRGVVITDQGDEKETVDIESFYLSSSLIIIAAALFGAIIGLVIQGLILNALYKRMYATTTALAYLPIANTYVCVKMAFGPKVAVFYIIAFFLAIPLSFIGIGIILSALLSIVSMLAFILVIVKLITKKYDLCYLEPFENNQNVAVGDGFSINKEALRDSLKEKHEQSKKSEPILGDGVREKTTGEEVLDLNYSDSTPVRGFDDSERTEQGFSLEDDEKKSSNEGNSDLMNLFK